MKSFLKFSSTHLPCPLLILLFPHPPFLFWATSSTRTDLTPIYMPMASKSASLPVSSQNQTSCAHSWPNSSPWLLHRYLTLQIWPKLNVPHRIAPPYVGYWLPFLLCTSRPIWNKKVFRFLPSLNPYIWLLTTHIMGPPLKCLLILFPSHDQGRCADFASLYYLDQGNQYLLYGLLSLVSLCFNPFSMFIPSYTIPLFPIIWRIKSGFSNVLSSLDFLASFPSTL